jgi:two-component system, LytTR family, sensor kinase
MIMEYDNDRLRKPTDKTELFYWGALILINPLVNGATLFLSDLRIWPLLLLVNLAVFPAYLFYSRIFGPVLLARKRMWFFALMTVLSFIVIQLFLLTIYALIVKFPLIPAGHAYFSWSAKTLLREGLWGVINLSLSIAIFHIRKAIEEKDALEIVQKDNTFFKLRYLRSQLNPHFLFNTLNSIYSLSLQKSDKTPEVVVRLADIMRYLIYECNEEKIPLDKEIEFIKNYIAIEQMRYKADVRLTIEGSTEGILIEPFLFISFIENGFKHAMDNSFAEPFIYITFKIGNGQIVLNVINSTNADLESQAKRMYGKGISNSRSLLELLYPDSYELDIIQTEKEESRKSSLRIRNARERLETLYPDSYTLDVILSKNAFTVSLIIKQRAA